MKLILILLITYLYSVPIINCKKVRAITSDEILDYQLSKGVPRYNEMFSIKNLKLEQVDDDSIEIGGYLEWLKSFDNHVPIQIVVETQTLEQAVWKDQPMKLTLKDACKDFLDPDRFWYNITKLWTAEVCPPKKGFKWNIIEQNCSLLMDMPDNLQNAPWRGWILIQQTLPTGKNQLGLGVETEFLPA